MSSTMNTNLAKCDLHELAKQLADAHADCLGCLRSGLEHARRAGEVCVAAKAKVGHGEWLPWLGENFEGSERTARGYMRVHEHWPEIEAKRQSSADLSIDGALKLLSSPRESDPPLEPDHNPAPTPDPPTPFDAPEPEPVSVSRVMSKEEYEAGVEQEPTCKAPSVAVRWAEEAINCLCRIPKDDPLREQELAGVARWIRQNR